jgi:large subunit ribosomal protein L10
MSKAIKSLIVKEVTQRLSKVSEAVFVDLSKLDGVSSNRLRMDSRKRSIKLLGGKSSLTHRSLRDLGWNVDSLGPGPTTIATGPDVVGLAKQAIVWEKDYPGAVIKGAYVGGQVVSPSDVKVLSESPSKEESIARILGGLMAAATAALSAINAQGANLASQIKQISEKEQAVS